MKVDAIVLAGASNQGLLKSESEVEYEALIDVAGRPIVDYVIQALLGSKHIEKIVLVGPQPLETMYSNSQIFVVRSGGSLAENIKLGLTRVTGQRQVLLVTADIPLLTSEAVDDFLRRCQEKKAAIYYPIVSREANERAYPGVKRTYVKLVEGVYTGGNLALIEPVVVNRCYKLLERAIAMRKKPLQLIRMLGFKFILKFAFNRLTISEIEKQAQKILGFVGVAVPCPYPEIGIDVDKPSDLELVRQALARDSKSVTGLSGSSKSAESEKPAAKKVSL